MSNRRQFIKTSAASAAALSVGALPAWAQALPETARIIVGFPPGGTTDAFARRVAQKLTGVLANNVIVENKPGAGGQLGVLTVKDANPDGLTLLYTPASMITIYPHSYSKLAYKAEDIAPITPGMATVHGFGVGPAVPDSVKNINDFIAWAKANPDKASVGNPGPGSMPHLLAETLSKQASLRVINTPFPGSGPGILQLIGGQISAMSSPVGDYLQHVKSGKLRLLATSGPVRSQFAPDIATYKEQGFGDLVVREWFGFFLPAKATAATREKVNAALRSVLAQKEVVDSVLPLGIEVMSSSVAEFEALVKKDAELAGGMVKALGFKADS